VANIIGTQNIIGKQKHTNLASDDYAQCSSNDDPRHTLTSIQPHQLLQSAFQTSQHPSLSSNPEHLCVLDLLPV
jgi:hypothetical protein